MPAMLVSAESVKGRRKWWARPKKSWTRFFEELARWNMALTETKDSTQPDHYVAFHQGPINLHGGILVRSPPCKLIGDSENVLTFT